MDPKSIAKQVKVRRQALDFTQDTLAAATKISKQTIWRLEQGDAVPAIGTLEACARVLGCTIDDLVHGDVIARINGGDRAQPAPSESGDTLPAVDPEAPTGEHDAAGNG